ncbi:hypothetical protein N7504_001622 [Penicillium tannophilum]|nr:hypothetical protein N7504_001622 [Penicillium tannophilum]
MAKAHLKQGVHEEKKGGKEEKGERKGRERGVREEEKLSDSYLALKRHAPPFDTVLPVNQEVAALIV